MYVNIIISSDLLVIIDIIELIIILIIILINIIEINYNSDNN